MVLFSQGLAGPREEHIWRTEWKLVTENEQYEIRLEKDGCNRAGSCKQGYGFRYLTLRQPGLQCRFKAGMWYDLVCVLKYTSIEMSYSELVESVGSGQDIWDQFCTVRLRDYANCSLVGYSKKCRHMGGIEIFLGGKVNGTLLYIWNNIYYKSMCNIYVINVIYIKNKDIHIFVIFSYWFRIYFFLLEYGSIYYPYINKNLMNKHLGLCIGKYWHCQISKS